MTADGLSTLPSSFGLQDTIATLSAALNAVAIAATTST